MAERESKNSGLRNELVRHEMEAALTVVVVELREERCRPLELFLANARALHQRQKLAGKE